MVLTTAVVSYECLAWRQTGKVLVQIVTPLPVAGMKRVPHPGPLLPLLRAGVGAGQGGGAGPVGGLGEPL